MIITEPTQIKVKSTETGDSDVIHVLRSTHAVQNHLIGLADQKANVLIGIIAIILTLLFTNITILKDLPPYLIVLLIVCLLIEVLAVFYALLVIMPKNVKGSLDKSGKQFSNPLYFGDFTTYEENVYVSQFLSDMNNNLSARQYIAKDIYQTGLVLIMKYRYLKYAYLLAVTGILSLIFFSLVSLVLQI